MRVSGRRCRKGADHDLSTTSWGGGSHNRSPGEAQPIGTGCRSGDSDCGRWACQERPAAGASVRDRTPGRTFESQRIGPKLRYAESGYQSVVRSAGNTPRGPQRLPVWITAGGDASRRSIGACRACRRSPWVCLGSPGATLTPRKLDLNFGKRAVERGVSGERAPRAPPRDRGVSLPRAVQASLLSVSPRPGTRAGWR